ncbi:LysR family transcriptional regulator [uncultured Selenomonas sp.]|uniref:LysR family transcriptional regulator n=1 Tax=uncultured Selenomonas sp. TaxID=159275 RepID=UPI0028E79B6C|nr:LysR family transcriptional regulator [uncultured Selenomonas sp.]
MTTKQMKYIIMLAHTLNFNRAAENLYISQPTMTYQIKAAEEEIGFSIFARSGRGAALTPEGAQFVTSLRTIYDALTNAIEQGQNFSAKYQEMIRVALPLRSALYLLPQAIRTFGESHPGISISMDFDWSIRESFLRGKHDILFAMSYEMRRIPEITEHPLFDSHFYLITAADDPLAARKRVSATDLKGRTLMVGGGSPPVLRALQQRIIQEIHVDYFNSRDRDTTLTNVAAHRGVSIAPGFLNDHHPDFAWIPFETAEVLPCALYTHKGSKSSHIHEFVVLLQKIYTENTAFSV